MDTLEKHLAVIHDIKSSLLAIERHSERLMKRESSLSENVEEALRVIHDSAAEASDTLEDTSFSSSLEASQDETRKSEPVNLARMTREVVQRFQQHAEHKGQTLNCVVPDPVNSQKHRVLGKPVQLREAMNNLVSNALKYSPSGKSVEVWVWQNQETVYFSVSDEGPGLSEEEREQVFEPFRTADPNPTGGEKSTGLGLYIVRRIVESHDGLIEVETEKGNGSTFTLCLPAVCSSSSRMSSEARLDSDLVASAVS